MEEAKFFLSKQKLRNQVKILKDLGLRISYSYKTNREVGNLLQKLFQDIEFSIHSSEEIEFIEDKSKIWFFLQAEKKNEIKEMIGRGLRNFVIDNEIDLSTLLKSVEETETKINISLRMKFQEHRIGTGKYFTYGLDSNKVNKIIQEIKNNPFVHHLGIHVHRKSQNTSEWNIKSEIIDSINPKTLDTISFFNIGGGLPANYRSFNSKNIDYIFSSIKEAKDFLELKNIKTYIEPGRFLAAPCIKLITEIIQIQDKNIIINTSLYKCALDTLLTGTKMLVENEIPENSEEGYDFLIKGNSPTRDDIFRYNVKLKDPKIGDKVIFLNAGAYNYSTDFFGYNPLGTEIAESF